LSEQMQENAKVCVSCTDELFMKNLIYTKAIVCMALRYLTTEPLPPPTHEHEVPMHEVC